MTTSNFAEALDIADEHVAWLATQFSVREAMHWLGIVPPKDSPRWDDVRRHLARRWLAMIHLADRMVA